MDIFNKIGDLFKKEEPKNSKRKRVIQDWSEIPESEGVTSPIANEIAPPLNSSDYLKESVGWVYACTSAIADEVATINLKLFRREGDNVEEIMEHPVLDLLSKVNDFTTKFDHWWLTQDYLELAGEAPWLLDIDESTGLPTSMFLLRPDRLSIKFDKEKIIGGYTYRLDGGHEEFFSPEQIIFIKYPSPIKPLRGRGTLEAAARTVNLDKYSEEWNTNFMFNSARPDAILTTDKSLTPEERKIFAEQWKKNFKGLGKNSKLAILEKGLEYHQMQLSQKDMDFLEQQKFSRDKILSIFRVPKPVITITDNVNRANAETGAFAFARWTIKPKMTRIIEQLNEFLIPMYGDEGLYLDFEDPVPTNVELKLKGYQSGLEFGYMTINEVRESEGLPSIQGGDTLYIPGNKIAIGSETEEADEVPEEEPTEPTEPTEEEVDNEKALKKIYKRKSGENLSGALKAVVKSHMKRDRDGKLKLNLKTKQIGTVGDKVVFWKGLIHNQEKFERRFVIKMEDIFKEQEKDTLKKLTLEGGKIAGEGRGVENYKSKYWAEMKLSIPRLLLNIKEASKKIVSKTKPIIEESLFEIGDYVLDTMDLDEGFKETVEVRKYLKENPIKFADSVNELTNEKLRATLSEGIAKGESVFNLSKRVEVVFEEAKKSRAQMIARTETSRAMNFATLDAYKQSGLVVRKEWLTAGDERTCQFCNPMNGKTVAISDEYFEKGGSFEGDDGGTLKFNYSNIEHPPLHPSCRCTLIPVVEAKTIKGKKNNNNSDSTKGRKGH